MEQFLGYLMDSYLELPVWVYEGLFAMLCVGTAVAFLSLGARRGGRVTLRLLLAEYVFVVLCSTVFFRPVMAERQYDVHPFWSYWAIQEGEEVLLVENIMNVVMFIGI